MRAALITRQATPVAPNVRLVTDHPDPSPGRGSVLVRTEAAALNHLDLWVGRGVPGLDLTYPRISGSDGCGIVEAVGASVDAAWIGRRVAINAAVAQREEGPGSTPCRVADVRVIGEHDDGCMAERFVAPVTSIVDVGATDPVEAAAFGLAHLTAWRMLVTQASVREGETVLITGIGGGVALAALAIARHHGCTTIVTSRHRAKLDRALQLGATHAVLDEGADWSKDVRRMTGRRGVDVCVDSIGQAVHDFCAASLARGGTFVTCGCTTGPKVSMNLARLFWLQQRFIGSTMGDMADFRAVTALLVSGMLRPVIDSVHEAANVQDAYGRLESGEQFGKVVVRWGR
jgi:zinc-binding alcohol dehydrogenase/oxidoreductase